MLTPEQIQKARQEIGTFNSATKPSVKSSWDDIVYPSQERGEDNRSLFEKVADTAGKVLEGATKYTGIKSAVDLVGTAGEGFSYAANKLTGNEYANKLLLENPSTESMKKANEQGTLAGVKDVLGKTLEVGASALPFAKGAGLVSQGAGKLATYGKLAGEGSLYGGLFGAGEALQNDEDFRGIIKKTMGSAALGAALTAGAPALFEGTFRALKNLSSLYSDAPKEALQKAFENPNVVVDSIRKYAKNPNATQEILTKANQSLDKIKQIRSGDYEKSLTALQQKGFKSTLDKGQLITNLKEVLSKFNKKILSKEDNKKLGELQKLYANWEDMSPLGINDLRRAIRNRVNPGNSKELNSIITRLETNLNNVVDKADPMIGKMRQKYAKDSALIEDLQKEIFGTSSKMADSTKLNRLLNIFKQNTEIKKNLVEKLGKEGGQDLINEITGAALSEWMPVNWVQRFITGQAGLSVLSGGIPAVPLIGLGVAGASPRISGETAALLGKINKPIQELRPLIEKYGIPALLKSLTNKE